MARITVQSQRGAQEKAGKERDKQGAGASVVSNGDLERMRQGFSTPEEAAAAAKREAIVRYEAQQAAFKEEQDKEAKKVEAMSESDKIKAEQAAKAKAKAALQLEEERDEVKRMNQMMLYSKCMAIRDKQLEEGKQQKAEEVVRQRALDAEMEVTRRKQVQALKEAEALRFEQRRAGMAVIEEQLQEREDARQQQLEQRRKDQAAINVGIELSRAADARLLEEKKLEGAKLLKDVMAGNAVMIQRKKEGKQREIEEDQRIAAFIKERDAKAAAALEEKVRQAKERELETARLRSQQEHAQDLLSQADTLRAKRWQEAAARREREEAQKAADKQAAQTSAITEARKQQAASKVLAQAALAQAEEAEFKAVLERVKLDQAKSKAQEAEAAVARRRHLDLLKVQVDEKERQRAALTAAHMAEGRHIKENLEREKAIVEAIRQKKLKQLQDEGIPVKYLSQLAREKF